MRLLKLSIFIFFFLSAFTKKQIDPKVNVGVTSLNQACTAQKMDITDFNIATVENAHANLYDLFTGNNLQITSTTTGGTQGSVSITKTVTSSASYPVPNDNLSLVNYDVYLLNQVQLMVDATGHYFVQEWTQPTVTTGPDVQGSVIPVVNALTTKCFTVKYVNSFTAVVDCEDMTDNQNYMYFVNLVKKQIDLVAPTQLLHDSTISSNYRDMQVLIQNERVYLLRTTLYNDWQVSVGVNKTTLYTYTEVARVTGIWSTFRPISVFTMPPIQYPGSNMNMQVVGVVLNSGKLYLLDQLQKTLWKISLDFTYITYVQDIEEIGIRGSMTTPLAIGTSQFEFAPIIIAYQGYYKGMVGVYMEELNPNSQNNGPVYLLDSQTTSVFQIGFGVHLVYAIYSNSVQNAFSIFMTGDHFHMDTSSNTTTYAPMIYQQIFDTTVETAMKINEIANTILISQKNSTSGVYSQSLWNIQFPELVISQAVAGTATTTISCYSGFQAFNTTVTPPTTVQATQTFKMTFVGQNYVTGMLNPFGAFSTAIGAQTMIIPTPGQEIVDLDQFYIAPALTYTVTLTASADSPKGWSEDIFQVYHTYQKFQNTSFLFKVIDGTTFNVGSITFIKPHFLLPGRLDWIIETNNDILYNFYEDEAAQKIYFSEMGKPHDISKTAGKNIGLEFLGPEQFVYVGSDNACTLNFYSASHSQQFWSTTLCDVTKEKIIKLKAYGPPNIYVVIQGINTATTDSNSIITISVSNQTFTSQANFNQMVSGQQIITGTFANTKLTDFTPLDVYGDWFRPQVIFIKCTNYVLVYNQQHNYVLYQATPTWTTPTNYAVAVTLHSLVLIQTNKVEEYITTDLTRIYKIRSQYPYYGATTQSYLIGDNQYAFSFDNVYLYEQTTKTLQVFSTGKMVPLIFMLFDQITLPVEPTYMFITHEFMDHFEQITLFGTNYCGVYNIYRQRTLAVSGYYNNSVLSATQTYQFTLSATSSVGTVTLPSIPYTVDTTFVPFTNITLNNSNSMNFNFIQMKSASATNMLYTFPSFNWFQGTVTNYYLECVDHPEECNTTIFMQNPIGPERLMGNESFIFWDMASGVNNFSFVQMKDKVLRLTGSENKIYDLVQLPFGDPYKFCVKMAVNELAQYSISACTDFSGEGWVFYFVSYLSTEPHVMGYFYDTHPSFIGRMEIQGNYLFVVESDVFSSGLHIYYIDFDEDFGDAGAYKYTLPTWLVYKNTVKLNDTIKIRDIQNVDILPTSDSSIFRIFMASSRGEFLSLDINPNQFPQNMIINVYYDDFSTLISSMDTTFRSYVNTKNFDTTLAAIKTCEYTSTTSGDQYAIIIAFKYYHAYELQVVYAKSITSGSLTSVNFNIKIRYQKYAFYEFQNNIKVLPDGFVMLSGFLPDHLANTNQNYSEHQFMAYDRTNSSKQQYSIPGASYVDSYLMGAYPFKNKALFPYMAQKFVGLTNNNYSITLVSPDNFTFFSYTLQRQAGVRITSGSIQSNNVLITATSPFQSYQVKVGIGRDFSSSGKSHPYWVIGVVLGSVALIVICGVAYWYFKKKSSGSAYTLGEENNNQQGLTEGN